MMRQATSRLTWPLVDAQTMRALDRYTIDDLGVSAELLMESAGRVSAEIVVEHLGSQTPGAEVLVVCGAGNNGGDGFVVARHLAQAGVAVRVCLAKAPSSLAGEAAKNLDRVRALRIPVEGLPVRLPKSGVVVDAILGTGLARPLAGEMAALVNQINASRSQQLLVVAIDLPTGLDADTGVILGAAVECDITVAISLPKIGLALEPGRSLAGRYGWRASELPMPLLESSWMWNCGRMPRWLRRSRRARLRVIRAASVMCLSSLVPRVRPEPQRWLRQAQCALALDS